MSDHLHFYDDTKKIDPLKVLEVWIKKTEPALRNMDNYYTSVDAYSDIQKLIHNMRVDLNDTIDNLIEGGDLDKEDDIYV